MKPNILFIILDSMRADKFYGKDKTVETPNIDSLIKKGTYFSQNFGSSDYTITGYESIFTGLYPINAGISGMNYHKIFSKVPNFIQQLRDYGYHLYSLVDAWSIKLGLADFENEDKDYDRTKLTLFNGLGERIINKLESRTLEEPWFYFIHIEDLHIPIIVPEKFKNKKYSERYDLALSEIDLWLGKILKLIDLERTLVVVTADHGDYILSIDDSQKDTISTKIKSKIRKQIPKSAYDFLALRKRATEHQIRIIKAKSPLERRSIDTRTAQQRYLYDDLIHLPLLFLGWKIPSKNTLTNLVRSIDIFPTIADLIEMPYQKAMINGRNLLPLIKGKDLEELPVYLENTIFATSTKSPIPCIGIRNKQYKYFRSLENKNEKIHLFDMINDPYEEKNIVNEKPDIVKKMESSLIEIRESLLKNFEEPEITDQETKRVEEELKKLGYI